MKSCFFFVQFCATVALLTGQDIRAQNAAPSSSAEPQCKPEYPEAAARAHAQGTTVLVFHVNEQGKPIGADVLRSSGPSREHRMLDKAALHALMLCPFQRRLDTSGQPQAYDIEVPYTWRLE